MGRGREGERLKRERGLINFFPLKRVGGGGCIGERELFSERGLNRGFTALDIHV